jgi:hypothetical protein
VVSGLFERAFAILDNAGAEALLLGRRLHQPTLGGIVIDDQNRLRHNRTIIRRRKALGRPSCCGPNWHARLKIGLNGFQQFFRTRLFRSFFGS